MWSNFFGRPEWPARLRAGLRATFASLRNRDFRIYCVGQAVSLLGTWMQSIALSWLVFSLTRSPLMLGIVSFASTAPVLFLSVFAGDFADRYDRKKIIVVTQWLEMLQAAILAVLALTGTLSVPIILGLSVFLGICVAFEMPARQTLVPSLVRREDLANAIGLNSALFNSSRMVGPALAGIIIGLFGAGFCFALNALSYVAALVTLGTISTEKRLADEPAVETQKELATGNVWQTLVKSGALDVLFLTSVVSLFGFQFSNVVLPVIVGQILKGGAEQLGWLSAAIGVGALAGSLTQAFGGNHKYLRKAIGLSILALAAALSILAWSCTMTLLMVAVTLAGFALSIHFGGANYTIQTSVPEAMRGRVMGIYSTCNVGLVPFGSLMAGLATSTFGITAALMIAAVACASASILFLRRLPKSNET